MKKILVIAAHPDDEALGCGGTIARLANEGCDVTIAILGEGITSRYSKREKADKKLLNLLKADSTRAGKMLGANNVHFFQFPDNRFDTVPLLEIIKVIESLVKDISPEVIYTHNAGDLNIDHQIVNRAVLTATRPVKGMVVKEIYGFEVSSSTEWAFQQVKQGFYPNVFIDITDTIQIKIEAFSIYESELHEFPHPRSIKAITATATRWGSVVGCDAAEAFEFIRSIR